MKSQNPDSKCNAGKAQELRQQCEGESVRGDFRRVNGKQRKKKNQAVDAWSVLLP